VLGDHHTYSMCFTSDLHPVQELAEGSTVTLEGKKQDGSTYTIPLAVRR
jgi:hypothetical protein